MAAQELNTEQMAEVDRMILGVYLFPAHFEKRLPPVYWWQVWR